jgi:hypothetical protein
MTPIVYRLVIEGELSERAARAFDGMTVSPNTDHTVLVGRVGDQAHLYELLRRVGKLGLTLRSAKPVESDEG